MWDRFLVSGLRTFQKSSGPGDALNFTISPFLLLWAGRSEACVSSDGWP